MTSTSHIPPKASAAPSTFQLEQQLLDAYRSCGLSSALVGALPYQSSLCWHEKCPNPQTCTKYHLSLFAAAAGLKPATLVSETLHANPLPQVSTLVKQEMEIDAHPKASSPALKVQKQNITDWKDALRQKLELKQQRQTVVNVGSDHDSGNESGNSQMPISDESREGSRGGSASPRTDGHSIASSGSSARDTRSPQNAGSGSILATILEGGSQPKSKSVKSAAESQPSSGAVFHSENSPFSVTRLLNKPNVTLTGPEPLLHPYLAGLTRPQLPFPFQIPPINGFLPPFSQSPHMLPYAMIPPGNSPLCSVPRPLHPAYRFGEPLTQPATGSSCASALEKLETLEATLNSRTGFGPLEISVGQHYQRRLSPCTSNSNSPATGDLRTSGMGEGSPISIASQSSSPSSTSVPLPSTSNATCVVCDDKASGFHYGVVSCEGCKGFFRRTVQKRMDYTCHKDGNCPVNRITRNRCQSCRYHKCIRMGMAKESVRQDGNRKRKLKDEKEEEELKATARLQKTISAVVSAHLETSPTVPAEEKLPSLANYIKSQLQGDAIAPIRRFASMIPGFTTLPETDRECLLKSAYLEILLLRCAFDYKTDDAAAAVNEVEPSAKEITDCVARLRDSLLHLEVFNEEVALLSAVCLLSPTREGLQNSEAVERLQEPLLEALRVQVQLRRPQFQNVFAKLLMKISDLRSIAVKANHCFL